MNGMKYYVYINNIQKKNNNNCVMYGRLHCNKKTERIKTKIQEEAVNQ